MKVPASSIYSRVRSIPSVKFEPDSQMTSFGGLVIFQPLFERLDLWRRLAQCCAHLPAGGLYSHALCLRMLVVHLLLGFRRLRDVEFYQGDPMVLRVLGLKQMPSVPTVSRLLGGFDSRCTTAVRGCVRDLVLERIATLGLRTLTLDFDGSVLSTKRHAEELRVNDLGNVEWRRLTRYENALGQAEHEVKTESFAFDSQNRLTSSYVIGQEVQNFAFQANG